MKPISGFIAEPRNDKTRLSAGSVLMFEKSLDAVNRSPAFERFVTVGFPTDKLGHDLEARVNIESERSLILKDNFDNVVIVREGQFNFGNDLALCRGELENAVIRNGFLSCA
jgi:hypothetical protein